MADDTALLDGRLPAMPDEKKFFDEGDPRVLGWLREAVQEGERINRADPAYAKMDGQMAYILGDQLDADRPSYLPKVVVNQSKKSVRTHVATLTDLKPLFAFKTENPHYQVGGGLLNKTVVAWWINTFADLDLADVIKIALTTGTGDCVCEYDPHLNKYGDSRLIARDPRDTLPVRPSHDRSIQSWEGVVIRESHSPNSLRGMYPSKAHLLMPDKDGSLWGTVKTRFRRIASAIVTPTVHDFTRGSGAYMSSAVTPEISLYRAFIRDRSINTTDHDILMGQPGTAWSYMVKPRQRLYPRKRLIVATERTVLFDGPSPYWHGLYPMSRMKLDSWPWCFLGTSLLNDLQPTQDAINDTINTFLSVFSQWANRGTIADKNSVPESLLRRFDPRKPNWKMKLNPTYGEGFKLVDGPTLPPWSMDLLALLFNKHDEHSGIANLQAMLELRQMPSADTIEKYYNAMTPELRLEGRQIELFLREIAEMIKCNIFQYYSAKRRIMILGDAGLTLNDFDYDPGTLVPALTPGMPGYTEELDASLPRDERAQFFKDMFQFYVQPNSILAMNAQETKMMHLQLARMGYMDFWTLMNMLEIPNVGEPPPIPLPPRDPTTAVMMPDLMTGQMMVMPEVRVPETITEKLVAQRLMGIGMTESPAGRPSSGQAPPSLEKKTDENGAPRQTVTESDK